LAGGSKTGFGVSAIRASRTDRGKRLAAELHFAQRQGAWFEGRATSLADRSDDPDRILRARRRKLAGLAVTRFFFHLVRGQERIADRMGLELRDQGVMSPAMLHVIHEVWPGTAEAGTWAGWSVEIANAQGHVVRVLPL